MTKAACGVIMPHMEASTYRFLGLAADAEAVTALLKSRLMLANNLLVGTFCNASRFFFASMEVSL